MVYVMSEKRGTLILMSIQTDKRNKSKHISCINLIHNILLMTLISILCSQLYAFKFGKKLLEPFGSFELQKTIVILSYL